jgi:hypothetical protein
MYKSFNQEIKTTVYSQPSISTLSKQHQSFTGIEFRYFLKLLKKCLLAIDLAGFFHPV